MKDYITLSDFLSTLLLKAWKWEIIFISHCGASEPSILVALLLIEVDSGSAKFGLCAGSFLPFRFGILRWLVNNFFCLSFSMKDLFGKFKVLVSELFVWCAVFNWTIMWLCSDHVNAAALTSVSASRVSKMVGKDSTYFGVRGVWAAFLGVSQVRQIRSDCQIALGNLKGVGLGWRLAEGGPSLDINNSYGQISPASRGSHVHPGGSCCLEVVTYHQRERHKTTNAYSVWSDDA